MFSAQISKRFKVILLGLLVVLNVLLRVPSIPHEKGRDSFFIHSLANSINTFGVANWWEHWLSVFGYYPYSYASGLPFTLSGISQLTGIDIEKSILLYSFIFGLFSIFVAFSLAGLIFNDFLFKYVMAFFYSISPGVMLFTTWEASARGPFMIFLPLLIFLLLSGHGTIKKFILSVSCLIFLFSLHHYAIFALILTIGYVLLVVFVRFVSYIDISSSWSRYLDKINYMYLIVLCASFMYPFLSHSMITAGSRYGWIISLVVSNVRFIGLVAFLAFGGLLSLSLYRKKNMSHWYILISFIFLVPFLYDLTYGMYLLLLYSIIFLSIGFRNSIKSSSLNTSGAVKIVSVFIVFVLLLSTAFTAFYNHTRTGEYKDLWYMTEDNYDLASWINHEISKDSRVFFITENNYYVRTFALQDNGNSILKGSVEGYTYGLINDSFLDNLERVSMTSS